MTTAQKIDATLNRIAQHVVNRVMDQVKEKHVNKKANN